MKYTKVMQTAKGWSSYIWLVKDSNGKEFILKEVREKSPRKDLAEREGKRLLLTNKVNVGPKVREINFKKNFVIMEYIKGKKLVDWILGKEFEEVNAEQLYFFIKELYKQLLALDSINLSHNQLQVGKNILVEKKPGLDGKENYFPVIIDFEKATIKENNHTRNIGQIESMFFYNPNGIIAKKTREKLNLKI